MAGNLRARLVKGELVSIAPGKTLLESLWNELLKEWTDPDTEQSDDYSAGYCVGIAFCIAKIEQPYVAADVRVESVIKRAREYKQNG